MKTIALVDKHEIARFGMRYLIEQRPDLQIVGESGDSKGAISLLERETAPDLLIVDLELDLSDSAIFVKDCLRIRDSLPILVVTDQDDLIFAERAIRSGVAGFLSKKEFSGKFLFAIETVLSGGLYLSRSHGAHILNSTLRNGNGACDDPVASLSGRELHVFKMIGSGHSIKDIAEGLGISRKTVESFREKVKWKLSFDNAASLKKAAVRWINEGEF